ncbi:hypothetical protein OHS71_38560 [Streptomyces sp. NBC_00377]|uniref:hypothetical protein n=1 Tax=unclassified Streptomyces TaxID=2593676 RepID=UPI002E2470AB|nr:MULTISPECIES: hypothetical protein [unclassified Streptomyces]
MRSTTQTLLYGLRAKGWVELFVAASSAAGCAVLLIVAAVGSVSAWWCLVAVPLGVFNAIEVTGFVLTRQGRLGSGS